MISTSLAAGATIAGFESMLLGWFGKLVLVGCSESNCYGGVIGIYQVRLQPYALLAVLEIKLERLQNRSISESELL